jgi:hypothetical protein
MSTRTRPCSERIGESLAQTEEWFAKKYRQIDKASRKDDYEREDALREEIEPYGVSFKRVMTLTLSGGGPSSWLEVELCQESWGFSVAGVAYHFADWFDHAERDVSEHEAPGLWRLAEYYADVAA